MKEKLGLRELIAIAIGSMIGGGIFSVIGVADSISGHATPFVFVMGGIIAAFAGYNYSKLALLFREDGASYTYLKAAFPKYPFIAGLVGWSVIIGYIGTLALYAYTFGAYSAAVLDFENSYTVRTILALGILALFLYINLRGVKAAGESEDLLVYIKVFIMFLMGTAGVFFIQKSHFTPLFDKGYTNVFLSGAIVFVAYEGFQLVTNSIKESINPQKDIKRAIFISIAVVTLIYIVLAVTVLGILTPQQIKASKEYAVAEALKPIFGQYGFVLASIAAMFATSSAINGTMFGASRMMADIAKDRVFPQVFAKMDKKLIPQNALFFMFLISSLFIVFGHLDAIVSFSSMTFLIVSLCVAVANLKFYKSTNSNIFIIISSIIFMSITISLMIFYLYNHQPKTLYDIACVYITVVLTFIIYHLIKKGYR